MEEWRDASPNCISHRRARGAAHFSSQQGCSTASSSQYSEKKSHSAGFGSFGDRRKTCSAHVLPSA